MSRRKQGGSIYVSTDPNVVLNIGVPGVSTTIGRLGPTIYKGNTSGVEFILTEDGASFLQTEDGLFDLVTESAATVTLSGSFPTGERAVPYVDGGGLTITGGTGPYTLGFISGLSGTGLAASIGSLRLTGTPVAAGTINLIAQVIDSLGNPSGLFSTSITIAVHITMSGTAPATANVGDVYAYHPTTIGGVGTKLYAVTSGAIPSGTLLDTATGFVDGTLNSAETANFIIGATDSLGAVANTGLQTTVISASSGLGLDTAFQTNFTYSTTNVANDSASTALTSWFTGRSQTSHADGTGKWQGEFVFDATGGVSPLFGMLDHAANGISYISTGGATNGAAIQTNGTVYFGGDFANPNSGSGANITVGGAFLVVLDMTARKGWVKSSANNTYFGGGDPDANTAPTFTWSTPLTLHLACSLYASGCAAHINTNSANFINTPAASATQWG